MIISLLLTVMTLLLSLEPQSLRHRDTKRLSRSDSDIDLWPLTLNLHSVSPLAVDVHVILTTLIAVVSQEKLVEQNLQELFLRRLKKTEDRGLMRLKKRKRFCFHTWKQLRSKVRKRLYLELRTHLDLPLTGDFWRIVGGKERRREGSSVSG